MGCKRLIIGELFLQNLFKKEVLTGCFNQAVLLGLRIVVKSLA